MAAIATDGKGNYLTLTAGGDWVPTAPPETKPAQDPYSGSSDVPGQPQGSPAEVSDRVAASGPAWQAAAPVVVGGDAPGYRQSDVFPIARREDVINDPNSRWYQGWALAPGPLRAIGHTPAENTTINPETGTMNIAPEALGAATALGGVGGLRFGRVNPVYVPTGTFDRSGLSPEFLQNPLGPSLADREMPQPSGPTMSTGIPPRESTPEMQAVPPGSPQPTAGETAPPQAAAPTPPTTAAAAKKVASSYYDIMNQTGGDDAALTPQFFDKTYDSAVAAGKQTEAGQVTAGPNAVTALIDRWQALKGKPLPLASAQEMYEGLGDLIDQEWSAGRLSKVGTKLADIQANLRDQIDNPAPGDTTGNAAALAAFAPARQAWSQAMKMDDLERIQYRAGLTDNPATSIKTQIRGLLTDPRNRYTPEERAALETAATRGALGGALHVFGSRLIPLAVGAVGLHRGGVIGGLAGGAISHFGADYLRNWASTIQQNRLGGAANVMGRGVPPPP
jgi:hypothetical protein